MKESSFFRKKDIIVIAVLLAVAAVFYFAGHSGAAGAEAEISVDGTHIKTVNLLTQKNGIYPVEGVDVTYEIKDGKIAFHSSDCHDKVCVGAGFIFMDGQTAVCLPNKVVISISGGDDGGVDIMLR